LGQKSLRPSTLSHRFKALASAPPALWTRRRRVAIAQRMLMQGLSVIQTSEQMGFANRIIFHGVLRQPRPWRHQGFTANEPLGPWEIAPARLSMAEGQAKTPRLFSSLQEFAGPGCCRPLEMGEVHFQIPHHP
jgi:hypothetical protein